MKKGGSLLNRLAKLYDRATGGASVAADPNNPLDQFWPRAADAAGVDLAVEWLEDAKGRNEQVLFFLVGGPGGGKSHVSSHLVSGLQEIEPKQTGLARRSHLYAFAKHTLLLVNDATIEEKDSSHTNLGLEIQVCLDEGRSLIACVNRGILVEELSKLSNNPQSPSFSVLEWLSNGRGRGAQNH